MEFKLNYLEKLLRKTNSATFSFNQADLSNETLLLKNAVVSFIQSNQPNKEKKRALSCLVNQLISFINQIEYPVTKEPVNKNLHHTSLIAELRNLILYIETVAGKWFNYSIYIPEIMQRELIDATEGVDLEIKQRLAKFKISPKLIAITLKPFINLRHSYNHIKFSRYFFTLSYYEFLNRFAAQHDFLPNPQKELVRLLIEVNLNSDNFKRYAIYYIDDKVKQCSNESDKIRVLYSLYGFVSETIPFNNMVYNPAKPHIHEYIRKIIRSRIKHFRKLNERMVSLIMEEPMHPYKKKISTTLKVAHLGLLCRLMYDEKIIVDTSCSELVNQFSNIFQAENSKEISAQNLRNNFYSPDEKTVKDVQKMLKGMLMHSNDIIYNLNYSKLSNTK